MHILYSQHSSILREELFIYGASSAGNGRKMPLAIALKILYNIFEKNGNFFSKLQSKETKG